MKIVLLHGQNHMVIEICPEKNLTIVPKPNAWVFVVDKSSSMREFFGEKINCQWHFISSRN